MKSILIALTAVCALTGVACAYPSITATYTVVDTGYRLDFVLQGDPWESSFRWGTFTTGITDLIAPVGWQAASDSRQTVWDTEFGSQYMVAPGQVLTGFSGTFATLPTQLEYYVSLTGPAPGSYHGTLVPTLVPEPCSLLALASGIAGLAGFVRKRRK